MIGMRKDIENQNQKFLPVRLAKKPASSCGDNNKPSTIVPTITSGMAFFIASVDQAVVQTAIL